MDNWVVYDGNEWIISGCMRMKVRFLVFREKDDGHGWSHQSAPINRRTERICPISIHMSLHY